MQLQFTDIRWIEILLIAGGTYALWYLYRAHRYASDTSEDARKKTFNGLTDLMRVDAAQDERNSRYRVQKQVAIILIVVSALFRPPAAFDMGIEGWSRLAALLLFVFLQFKYIIGSKEDETDRHTKLAMAERTLREDDNLRHRLQDAKDASDIVEGEMQGRLDENVVSLAEAATKVEDVTAQLAASEAARLVGVDTANVYAVAEAASQAAILKHSQDAETAQGAKVDSLKEQLASSEAARKVGEDAAALRAHQDELAAKGEKATGDKAEADNPKYDDGGPN